MKKQIYWLQHAWIFTRQKKSTSNENWWNNLETPLFIWGPPPLSTNPLFLSNFFMTTPLCPNFKNKKPPLILRGTMINMVLLYYWKRWRIVANWNIDNSYHKQKKWFSKYYPAWSIKCFIYYLLFYLFLSGSKYSKASCKMKKISAWS